MPSTGCQHGQMYVRLFAAEFLSTLIDAHMLAQKTGQLAIVSQKDAKYFAR